MNILYLVGLLLLLILLGYPYVIFVISSNQQGAAKIVGRTLSGVFVLVLLALIVLYQTGVAQIPGFQFFGDRASPRMRIGMSGYVTGMMLEDENTIDEFINSLKTNPALYEKFKEKLKP